MKGGKSVIKTKAGKNSPKLHYVHPTCFEAGKPIEFLACGSNLLQPRLRFLVSFAGKYMTNDVCVSPFCNQIEASATNSNHQFLNIRVPHTELDVFGPGFIEVENESGLSNFIPILVADKEVCSEIKTMQMKYYSTHHSRDSAPNSCEVAVYKFSELLLDMAWLFKQPIVQDLECDMISSQLQRFTFLLKFLIEYESIIVLKRVLHFVKMRIINNSDMVETDKTMIQETVKNASEFLNQQLEKNVNIGLHLREMLPKNGDEIDQMLPYNLAVNQDMQISENVGLLTADCVMSVTPYKEPPEKPSNRIFTYYHTNRFFTSRPLIVAVAVVTLCFGICAVVFHPRKATTIAITIHRCLFDDN